MILLIILGEYISLKAVKFLREYLSQAFFLHFADRGFLIDKDKSRAAMVKYNKEHYRKRNKFLSLLKILLGFVLLLIPGVNMITNYFLGVSENKKTFKVLEENNCLIPMDEALKKAYESETDRVERTKLVVDAANKRAEFKRSARSFFEENKDSTLISNERLLPLGYTYDEVQKLNSVMGGTVKFGVADDSHTAIIGVPSTHGEITSIILNNGSDRVGVYPFKNLSEEEAKKHRFIVYPFTSKKAKELENTIVEIRKERDIKEASLQGTINGQKTNYSSYMEEEGMKLSRIIK